MHMPVKGIMGIIGCLSLADELVYLLERDKSISSVYVITNSEGRLFTEMLSECSLPSKVSLIEIENIETVVKSQDRSVGFSTIIWLNPPALHDEPPALWKTLSDAAILLSKSVNSILMCYGRCRMSPQMLTLMMDETDVPVTFLTDSDGEIVDDCFGANLGGRKEYLDCLKSNECALLVTTGYVENWKKEYEGLDLESLIDHAKNMKLVVDVIGCKKIIKLEAGVGNEKKFDDDVDIFSRMFGLEVDSIKCNLKVFENSYDLAKRRMNHMYYWPFIKLPNGVCEGKNCGLEAI